MSVRVQKLRSLAEKARHAHRLARSEKSKRRSVQYSVLKWLHLLHHEYLKDDVRVRAESLAYLMLFSTLPLIAGCFFVFTLFAQVGMVQDALQGVVDNFLSRIPDLHRGYAEEYILKFKDTYLETLTKKSGSLGIFSFAVLAWVGLKVYSNIELTLNHIWCSERQRPFLERVRNFIVVSVVAPIVIIGGLSVPLILKQLPVTKEAFQLFPILSLLLNDIVPPFLIFIALSAMYKFLPVERVKWRAALMGAGCAVAALELTTFLMQIYFRFGTNSAYGKAAILPILGFWIYIVWIVIILGAEIAYVLQHERTVLNEGEWYPSFKEGEGLLNLLSELNYRHRVGKAPLSQFDLCKITGLEPDSVKRILQFCLSRYYLVSCFDLSVHGEEVYVIAREINHLPISQLLKEFYANSVTSSSESSRHKLTSMGDKVWAEGLKHWLGFFQEKTLGGLNPKNPQAKD